MTFQKPIGVVMTALVMFAMAPALIVDAQTKTPPPKPTAAASKVATAAATSQPIDLSGFKCTLAAADCTLLATANANVGSETSFKQAISFKFNLSQAGSTAVNVQATGTGAFSIDPTATLSDVPSLYQALQLQLSLSGSSAQQSGKLDFLLTNGVLYLQTPQMVSWIGVDLIQAYGLVQELQANASSAQTATNQAFQTALIQLIRDPEVQAAQAAIPNLPGWIVQQRLPADAFLEGQRMAQI